ncbi:nitroreductase family deazaflavin-dependent oxidoreductase [Luteipulveratus flavus]|uniref:Nitroreductase family deazaflavin-dependent oxidoreductase n=1 Tax=Luteipulveratus flavus TaxID=3031728 RepID=A0ABT6CAC7_9MICO|nr:nitroreductase family deazaflavin-dependent oxidoreductase [Luteipulveratus sp. YIM 133296]MDF8265701.1 nitroreductase family deazaflavin-dependent oxidoreductase [Luteipulveratus sp. YIM 133296]
MPLPPRLGRINRVGLNRITRHLAPHLPGLGVVVHRGRRSGREFRTPVNVFPVDDGFVLALTYGARTDWVRNVLAAGGCEIVHRGRTYPCSQPRVYCDPQRRHIRPLERWVLTHLLDVQEFLALSAA